jgi:peptidyl-prolyl cis-trans isomerase C
MTSACAAALLLVAGVFAVHAQDTPAEQPPAMTETPPATTETPPAAAEPAPETAAPAEPAAPVDPATVVARVGDLTVTEGELKIAEEMFANELSQVPAEQARSVLIDALVNMKLFAIAATEAGLDKTEEFERRMDFLKMQALRAVYLQEEVTQTLTQEELDKGYQEMVVAQHTPEEQVHARHILVEKKEEAEKIITDLKAGKSFEELAKQSKDPSGENGGDLGFFGRGQMVQPFEEAAFALEPGTFTETPVQSEFGWHVIKVEEKKMSEPPTLAEVEEPLRDFLQRQKFEAAVAALREKYPIEIIGEAPAAEEAAPAAGEAAPAEGDAMEATPPAEEVPPAPEAEGSEAAPN